jgi:hypothetical protein
MYKQLFSGIFFLFFIESAVAIEEPKYTVLEKSEPFELRAYSSKVIAEVLVAGNLSDASSEGFKLIADYIFGNNSSGTGNNEKISMTAPVTMASMSKESSMAVPVIIEKTTTQWRMYFVMPSKYTLDTLPKPNNAQVKLRNIPAGNYAVIQFSGLAGEAKVAHKTADLMWWLNSKNIRPLGVAQLARYNPPWTLPFLRRNEILVVY